MIFMSMIRILLTFFFIYWEFSTSSVRTGMVVTGCPRGTFAGECVILTDVVLVECHFEEIGED